MGRWDALGPIYPFPALGHAYGALRGLTEGIGTMPSKRFDDMSRHDPPGRIQWRINLETGELEANPGYDREAEREFARRRMYRRPTGRILCRNSQSRGTIRPPIPSSVSHLARGGICYRAST